MERKEAEASVGKDNESNALTRQLQQQHLKKAQRDEINRKRARPKVTESDALEVFRKRYVRDGEFVPKKQIKMLDSYDDVNFLFRVNDDKNKEEKRIIVKFHNGVDSLEPNDQLLDAQEFAMMHLEKCKIKCSVVLKTNDGDSRFAWAANRTHENSTIQMMHSVKALHFVEGALMDDVVKSFPTSYEREENNFWRITGSFVGIVCRSLDLWSPFLGGDAKTCYDLLEKRESLWDLRHFADVRFFLKELLYVKEGKTPLSDEKIGTVEKTFRWYEELVLKNQDALRIGVIHNDLNESNVLVCSQENKKYGSLEAGKDFACIDFGDICVSWKVNELAAAMAYCALIRDKTPFQSSESMFLGFTSKYSLTPHEIKALSALVMARMVTSLVMGLYSHHFGYKENDDNEKNCAEEKFQDNTDYLLKTQQTGWSVLECFVREGPTKLEKKYSSLII